MSATSSLKLTRVIRAPIARVFAAWTTPSDMMRWFGPGQFKVTLAEADVRPGGAWRVRFHSALQNREVEVHGEYREVTPFTRLVFTWVSENPAMNFGETKVTVDLADTDGSTQVSITHEGFPAESIRERHMQGWLQCCENLEKLFAEEGRPA